MSADGEINDPAASEPSGRRWRLIVLLLVLFAGSLALRVPGLGNTFQTGDNVEPAARVVAYEGYGWMVGERYGLLISLLVKVGAWLFCLAGITLTEFWWKLPVALAGALQAPLAFAFLRRLGCSRRWAFLGGAAVMVLPLHVMQSRYLWGYEVLGVLFVTLALWALMDFLREPTRRRSALASLLCGMYLISHGYIIPFAGCVMVVVLLAPQPEAETVWERFRRGVRLLVRRGVWVMPLLFLPLYRHPLGHALRKPGELGFYVPAHLKGFAGNMGWPLAGLCIAAVVLAPFLRGRGRRICAVLVLCGAAYLLPLFLCAPPGVTVVRGYMLVGTYLWVLCAALLLGRVGLAFSPAAEAAFVAVLALTAWGTVETVFWADRGMDPAGVLAERGVVSADPGTKAAGYLVQKHVPASARVLAVHPAVEHANLVYYFRRTERAFNDLSRRELAAKLGQYRDRADVIVCAPSQRHLLRDGGFEERVVLRSGGEDRMCIFARPGVPLPRVRAGVGRYNEAFDRNYAWRVTFW